MRNVVAIILFLMSTSLFGQQTDTIGEYFLQPIEVQKNDNLWQLAERHYQDGRQYSKFWTVSKTKGLTNNPDSIYPGMVLYKLAKRTRLPDYHEHKFDSIYAALFKQKRDLDSLSVKINKIKKEVNELNKDLVLSMSQKTWRILVSIILGIISSLIASKIYDRFGPKNKNKWAAIILPGLLTTLLFLTGFDVDWDIQLFGNNPLIQKWGYSTLLVVLIVLVFLALSGKEDQQNKPINTSQLQNVIPEFYKFLLSGKKTSIEFKYWIELWEMYGEEKLSIEIQNLRNARRKQEKELIADNIESMLKSIIKK
ncbi:LysM peptidoglycan-binding domain-containing protein [Allomuricauda sp. M10]|uniref:LysM peptidoglycan-binding domain-containing protein n=1 Tax=Allomuricauda sp. M10 TaxID=2683292 RepID=UPI001D17E9D0|nr:LysM peptidoglycan-binding domain-containing protein [Muricauda sp. M10]